MRASPGDVVRSLAFYPVFYLGTAGYVLASLAMLPFSPKRFAAVVWGWSRFHRACVEGILGIEVRMVGGPIPPGVLIASKHESFLEAIDLPQWTERPAIFAKAELLRIPLWGKAAGAWGLIAVEREQGARALRAMTKAARAIVAQGRSLAIFPEGTRVPHGAPAPLGAGFAGLYKMLGLPVVPVAVDSGRLYHRLWKKRGRVTLLVGEPIPPGLPREEIEARVLTAINALNRRDGITPR